MHRRIFLAATVAFCGLAISAVSTAQAQDTVTIGFGGGITGYLAFYDGMTQNGLRLAVDEINAAGGIGGKYKIDLQVKDVRSEAPAAATAGAEFAAAGVTVMIAPCDVDPAIAFSQPAQQAGIPVIAPCASTPTLANAVGDFMFQIYPADTLQAAVLAKFARDQGYGNAYILLSPDTPYTEKLPLYFADVFQKLGGKVAAQGTYTFGQQDFSAEVTNIKGLDPQPDVIMTSAYEPDFPAFIKQLRGAGITTPVLGSDGIDSPTTLALGDVAEGVIYSTGGFPAPGSTLEKLYKDYVAKFGGNVQTDVSPYAATAYEAVKLIETAIVAAGSTDGAAVRDALNNIADYQGISGSVITLAGQNRIALRDVTLIRVEKGAKALVANLRPDPATVPAPQ
ncbi:MAG TPA: ABC transporter substrate-binding protein [Dongiaceae bacterium]